LLHGEGKAKEMAQILVEGTSASDFKLRVTPDQWLSLSDLQGRPVILAFYPADWSPVCGDQMTLYNEILPEFRRHGAELLGISVDGAWWPRGLRQRPPLAFPAARRLPPQGRGRQEQRGLSRERRRLRDVPCSSSTTSM
jgi:thiol-disulfide isomerase/thioredoxin